MSSSEDASLARRIRSGDRTAEEEFARRFQHGLMAIAIVRAGRDRAADLVQEALMAALPNLRRGDWKGEGPLAAYLAAILRRLIHGTYGRNRAVQVSVDLDGLPSPAGDPADDAERAMARRRLVEALARLPDPHRSVLVLHYLNGRSAEQIGRDMGIPRGTVLSRLHHARRKLRRMMNRPGRRGHKPGGTSER